MFVYLFNLIVMTLRNKTWHKPKCRWNANNFHSHDVKSVLLRILYFLCLSIATLSIKMFFFWLTEKITLWFWTIKLNHDYFLLLQLVPPANILMDLVDSFQLQIFQVASLSTVDVPGILQFPAGTSLNLASSTFDWSQISTVPAIMMLQEPVLQSQMLLQMMGISRSCCAVSLFRFQCTR